MSTKNNDPRKALADVSEPQRLIFCNVRSLQQLADSIEKPLVNRALSALPVGGDAWAPSNYTPNWGPGSVDKRLSFVRAILAVLENSDEFKAAEALIVPIQKAIAELEVKESAARVEHANKRQIHAEAMADAEAKALDAARKHPNVVAAEAALNEASAKLPR